MDTAIPCGPRRPFAGSWQSSCCLRSSDICGSLLANITGRHDRYSVVSKCSQFTLARTWKHRNNVKTWMMNNLREIW
eukprot:4221539-Karenia_brevis.AAC.1